LFASVGREVPVMSCYSADSAGSEVPDPDMPLCCEVRVGRLSPGISPGSRIGPVEQSGLRESRFEVPYLPGPGLLIKVRQVEWQ
jgi:hypothetical protein